MEYDSKTKKCTCAEKELSFEDVCINCKSEYEAWCEELVAQDLTEVFGDAILDAEGKK